MKFWSSVSPPLPHAPLGTPRQLTFFLLFRALGEFLPNDTRQVEAPLCTCCPLVAIGQEAGLQLALPLLLVQVFLLVTPSPQDHCPLIFPCGLLLISVPSLYPIGDCAPPHPPLLHPFPPSMQLLHQPVIGFCRDPYTCISSAGKGVPLTYKPHLGSRQ